MVDPVVGASAEDLVEAARSGDAAVVQQLLGEGADPNEMAYAAFDDKKKYGKSPLMTASSYGHVEVARLLLDAGADPKLTDNADKSDILGVAAMKGKVGIVELFLTPAVEGQGKGLGEKFKYNVDPTSGRIVKTKFGMTYGQPPLYQVAGGSTEEDLKIATMLLDAGASPDTVGGSNSVSVLEEAMEEENLAMINLLLEAGANPNKKTRGRSGKTMLYIAIQCNNRHGTQKDIIKTLLEHGADPEATMSGSMGTVWDMVKPPGRTFSRYPARDRYEDERKLIKTERRKYLKGKKLVEREEKKKSDAARPGGKISEARLRALREQFGAA